MAAEQPELIEETLQLVADEGPIRASATGIRPARPPPRADVELARGQGRARVPVLGGASDGGAADQLRALYDIPERVLPPEILAAPTPSREDAQRELTRIAAAALGVATEPDLGDYFRLPRADSKARVAELAAAGELTPVRGPGLGGAGIPVAGRPAPPADRGAGAAVAV